MERPPFFLPQAKSMIFIYTQSHETIMFMEYQMQANTVVLSRASVITRGDAQVFCHNPLFQR